MNKLFLILVAFNFTTFTKGQVHIKKYVEENTISISTVEPDSVNYSDLERLSVSIGDSKIVMLGEQDHGDAPTFLAKTRLIKYLHEKKGFNVIAFESDFFGLNFGWKNLVKSSENVSRFIHKNIFPIWTGCNACWPLFEKYIPESYNTLNPLEITGFDNQMILDYSSNFLVVKLDSVLRSLSLPVTKQENYQTEILPLIDTMRTWYYMKPKDSSLISRCGQHLALIKEQAKQKLNKSDYWMMVIENLVMENLTYKPNQNYRIPRNTRDYQMAVNLKWLSENKYPHEKIIVWAANYHISKYADSTDTGKSLASMGNFFTRDNSLKASTYILGFTSYEGEAGRLGSKNFIIPKPMRNGFETWINENYDYGFVDFRSYTKTLTGKSEKFFLKGLGHANLETDWTKIFDGIFFIRKMYPCQKG